MRFIRGHGSVVLSLAALATPVLAQEATPEHPADAIEWQEGPVTGKLSNLAEVEVPEGLYFADAEGAKTFLELTQNLPSGGEVGVVLAADDSWFAIFEFDAAGYVKDEDKDELDADDLLDTIRAGTEAANEVRRERGWPTIDIVGWQKEPFYDPQTNNLSWGVLGQDTDSQVVNYSTRLLGRKGYMTVNLVLSPDALPTALPQFETLLAGFEYKQGHRYAEFTAGDKVAEYGLAALVAGGAGVVAAKTGILAKFWKIIVAGVVAVAAFFRRAFGGLFGGSKNSAEQSS